jgi:RimJ/RimL family protein N-acetyltransferase
VSLVAPTVHTDRLLLRPYRMDDLDDLFAIRSRPDVVRYLYQDAQRRDEIAAALPGRIRMHSLEREGDGMILAVELRETSTVIGDVSLRWVSERHRQGDIGFVFHPDHHGKGYASEAAREVLRLGFETVRFHRIEGRCDARNRASARLMERLGMRREAHFVENEWFKGGWGSELVYAILDHEWSARTVSP